MIDQILQNRFFVAGLTLGLSIHLRIYPVIFVFSIFLYILRRKQKNAFLPLFKFFAAVSISFVSLFILCYNLYQNDFFENSYLYHLKRIDLKHNFSIYFYYFYLFSQNSSNFVKILKFVPFIVQTALIFAISLKFYANLFQSLFFLSFCFVTFNKVYTAQYLSWYYCLMPLAINRMTITEMICIVGLSTVAQVNWIYWSEMLEGQGEQVFLQLFFGCVLMFLANLAILVYSICHFKDGKVKID
ncbi:GPI mannosyltransferase 1 [Bonamia ostreae]|uniref:GPI mannosyltransferase 1 n=1 Tax=Bonamia ostreae TaxID=126728 RepID=A0ABV2AIX5_9EUKA